MAWLRVKAIWVWDIIDKKIRTEAALSRRKTFFFKVAGCESTSGASEAFDICYVTCALHVKRPLFLKSHPLRHHHSEKTCLRKISRSIYVYTLEAWGLKHITQLITHVWAGSVWLHSKLSLRDRAQNHRCIINHAVLSNLRQAICHGLPKEVRNDLPTDKANISVRSYMSWFFSTLPEVWVRVHWWMVILSWTIGTLLRRLSLYLNLPTSSFSISCNASNLRWIVQAHAIFFSDGVFVSEMKYGFQHWIQYYRDVGWPNATLRNDASYCVRVVDLFVYYSDYLLRTFGKKGKKTDRKSEIF